MIFSRGRGLLPDHSQRGRSHRPMGPGPLHGCRQWEAYEFTKATASMSAPRKEISDEYRWETSLSHMTRVSIEVRSRTTAEWITSQVNAGGQYKPPPAVGSDATSSADCVRRWLVATTNYCSGMERSDLTFATRSKRSIRASAGGPTAANGSRATTSSPDARHGPRSGICHEGSRRNE